MTIYALIVHPDDLGWYDTAIYNPTSPTPSIKSLCEEGMRLDHHYVFRYCRFVLPFAQNGCT